MFGVGIQTSHLLSQLSLGGIDGAAAGRAVQAVEILLKLNLRSYSQMNKKMVEPMSASDHKCSQS